MDNSNLLNLSLNELIKKITKREISSQTIVSDSLSKIKKLQDKLNAFVIWDEDKTISQAGKYDNLAERNEFVGPLHGVPIALKDNYWTIDYPTTGCSKILQDNPFVGKDSTVASRLRQAGAIIIGKTNMHEWAYGATNEFSSIGPTRNPWNLEHITGGSSGGSGAALAARMVPATFGSDTLGSVRMPSSACGVCGIKPTYGLVSRYGILPLAWSLDCAGPMARSAIDLSILMKVIIGEDPKDPTTKNFLNKKSLDNTLPEMNKLKFAIPCGEGFEFANDVSRVFNNSINIFKKQVSIVEDIKIEDRNKDFAACLVIQMSEATTYHKNFMKTSSEKYSQNVLLKLETGRFISATDYLKAQQYRIMFNKKMSRIFDTYDTILLPTVPVTAPKIGQERVIFQNKNVNAQEAMTYFPWIANFSGLPSVSIPCGFGDDDLPVGMMLIGKWGSDFKLLKIAEEFQKHTEWHLKSPSI